jgi:hypothetical protein
MPPIPTATTDQNPILLCVMVNDLPHALNPSGVTPNFGISEL